MLQFDNISCRAADITTRGAVNSNFPRIPSRGREDRIPSTGREDRIPSTGSRGISASIHCSLVTQLPMGLMGPETS